MVAQLTWPELTGPNLSRVELTGISQIAPREVRHIHEINFNAQKMERTEKSRILMGRMEGIWESKNW